ncbi:MAG: glycosyltransferase, partial [Burkholderiales bacterium]|nr:glycosyltransferase [Burkholderiales bacterium]
TCLTTTPLRILSIFGGLLALGGFVLALLLIVLRFLLGADWGAEGVFMLFSLLFIFIGAQFVGMGLLGEYIGRIYQDVRARPRYFVQKTVGQRRFSNKHEDHV